MVHQVCVTDGQEGKIGAPPLFGLAKTSFSRLGYAITHPRREDLRSHEESLAKNGRSYASQLEIKTAEIAQAGKRSEIREKNASTSRDLVARMEKLSRKKGGIAQVELIKYRLEAAESEKDLSVAQRTLQQVNFDRERIQTEHARQRNQDASEIEKLKVRLAAVKGDMENSQLNLLTVRAPYDAFVISLAQRNAGSVVQNGQELCQLAPKEGKPRARLTLSEAGLPKLSVGQRVRFFFDAFPYQRYGAVSAKLDWISPRNCIRGWSTFCRARVTHPAITSSRKPLPLRVGMGGQARIVGRSTHDDLVRLRADPAIARKDARVTHDVRRARNSSRGLTTANEAMSVLRIAALARGPTCAGVVARRDWHGKTLLAHAIHNSSARAERLLFPSMPQP